MVWVDGAAFFAAFSACTKQRLSNLTSQPGSFSQESEVGSADRPTLLKSMFTRLPLVGACSCCPANVFMVFMSAPLPVAASSLEVGAGKESAVVPG